MNLKYLSKSQIISYENTSSVTICVNSELNIPIILNEIFHKNGKNQICIMFKRKISQILLQQLNGQNRFLEKQLLQEEVKFTLPQETDYKPKLQPSIQQISVFNNMWDLSGRDLCDVGQDDSFVLTFFFSVVK